MSTFDSQVPAVRVDSDRSDVQAAQEDLQTIDVRRLVEFVVEPAGVRSVRPQHQPSTPPGVLLPLLRRLLSVRERTRNGRLGC